MLLRQLLTILLYQVLDQVTMYSDDVFQPVRFEDDSAGNGLADMDWRRRECTESTTQSQIVDTIVRGMSSGVSPYSSARVHNPMDEAGDDEQEEAAEDSRYKGQWDVSSQADEVAAVLEPPSPSLDAVGTIEGTPSAQPLPTAICPEEVLEYWVGGDWKKNFREKWFTTLGSSQRAAVDREISTKFSTLLMQAGPHAFANLRLVCTLASCRRRQRTPFLREERRSTGVCTHD